MKTACLRTGSALAFPCVPTEEIELVWYGIDHPEGIAIDDEGVVWTGGEAGQIYCGTLDGKPEIVARLPGRTLGIALDAEGNAYCADMTARAIYRLSRSGRVTVLTQGSSDRRAREPNHVTFLPNGRLAWTDSGDIHKNDGCIFSTSTDGQTRLADRRANHYPNGLAVSCDGQWLAVAESALPGVSLLRIDKDGCLTERRLLVELPGTVPDGLAFDVLGRLLVCCWAPDAILLVDGDDGVSVLAHDERRFRLNQPTNIAFVPGTRTLVAANIGDRYLSVISHTHEGAPLLRPTFPWNS